MTIEAKNLIKEIRQYAAETTAMLNKNSVEELKRFCERHRDYVPYNPTEIIAD